MRDAFVMAVAFGGAAVIPLLPFLTGRVLPALALSGALTLLALFGVGIVKSRVGGVVAGPLGAGSRRAGGRLGRTQLWPRPYRLAGPRRGSALT